MIDADAVARETEMGNRINTVMQPCFFQLSGVLPPEDAIAKIKASVEKAYANRGRALVERNFAAIDRSLERLRRVTVPAAVTSDRTMAQNVPDDAPDFVKRVTARLMAGDGDLLPVSALPVDGTFPTGTAKYEKRAIAKEIPIWDPEICIDCGKCAIVCPHATIRMKVFEPDAVDDAPASFASKDFRSKDISGYRMTIQIAPDDCTGCGVCVDVCPAKSKTEVRHKAINMEPVLEHRDAERANWDFFLSIPPLDRDLLPARLGEGLAGARAAVRVLRRVRGLRRDALPQAGHPTLRRPHDRRQRHRLLVDLRRQPAHHAMDGEPRGPRAGVEQLAVRGQRRVRPRDAPRPRRAEHPSARVAGITLGASRRGPRGRHPRRGAGDRARRSARSASASRG